MQTKTITLPFDFHALNGAASKEAELKNGELIGGRRDTIIYAAGTPLTFPVEIADRHLRLFEMQGAEEVDGPGVDVLAIANAKPITDPLGL